MFLKRVIFYKKYTLEQIEEFKKNMDLETYEKLV